MSYRARRTLMLPAMLFAAALLGACQSAEDSTDTLDVDDFCDGTATPNPATAVANPDGNTYRVVRGNNQPDDIYTYTYKVTFGLSVSLNSTSLDDDVDLEFPVDLTTTSVQVNQASNGIVVTATGSDTEHYESMMLSASAKTIAKVDGVINMNWAVWYSLPSGGKEALITLTLNFKDDDGVTFAKTVKVNVNP
jgi:hypothetical protein